MYSRCHANTLLIVGIYVDDLVIAGAKPKGVQRFKEEMKWLFNMSDLGLLRYYLGLEVNQERGRTPITQSAYATKMLKQAGMADCHPVQYPMEAWCKLSKESNKKPVDSTFYQSIICSLRYLVHTRPNISFAV